MLKGTQRKVIVLKDTKSGIFEEAYFIVKKSADSAHLTTEDMVSEANRIISDSVINGAENKKKPEIFLRPLWFFIGVLCCAVLILISMAAEQNYL